MAPTFVAAAVQLLLVAFNVLGIQVAPGDLSTTITTLAAIGVPIFVMFRQWWTGRSTPFGSRPR